MNRLTARLRGAYYRARLRLRRPRVLIGRGLLSEVRCDIRGPGTVIIGEDVLLARMPGEEQSFVTIYTHSPDAEVRIGDRTKLYSARISCRFSVQIGHDVLIEDAGITDTDFHSADAGRGPIVGETRERCRVEVRDKVGIGSRAIVTKGVIIGEAALVGPGSVVTRSLPPGCFAIGNPAKVVTAPWNVHALGSE